jgi:hypothetical protein
MAKTVKLSMEVPDDVSDESVGLAERQAKEAAVVAIQQRGEISIRVAAMKLDLTYEGYLDLLAAKGLPATSGDADPAVIETFQRWLSHGRMSASQGGWRGK